MNPFEVLRTATKAVPAVKYALGVAGVVAVVAIVASFQIDYRIAVIGTILVMIGMVVLVISASAVGLPGTKKRTQAIVLTWFALIMLMLVSTSLFGCVFFRYPLDLTHWLDPELRTRNQEQQNLQTLIAVLEARGENILSNWATERTRLQSDGGDENLTRIQDLQVAESRFAELHKQHIQALNAKDFTLAHEKLMQILRLLALQDRGIDFVATMVYAHPQGIWAQKLLDGRKPSTYASQYPGVAPDWLDTRLNAAVFQNASDAETVSVELLDELMRPAFGMPVDRMNGEDTGDSESP